jgi:hypothetical protein
LEEALLVLVVLVFVEVLVFAVVLACVEALALLGYRFASIL